MERRVEALVARMTLEQKASLCSGRDFWNLKGLEELGLPSILLTDGPHGLRKQRGSGDHVGLTDSVPATCFPSLAALGSSWDRDLVRRVGVALGEECRQENVAVILGPGLNIKRSALCGRNFEYLSEDPYLTGQLASAMVQGVQSQGIGTAPKHFAANNQETRRMTVDALVDERALREIYLPGFEEVVREARPWSLMTAYNRVNGSFCSENEYLLRRVLREDWGFEGVTVTDWGGTNDRIAGLRAGQDLEMPSSGGLNDRKIVAAVREGRLSEAVLDASVKRLVHLILTTHEALTPGYRYDADAHQTLAREAAIASSVLLKNDGALPLAAHQSVAVVGRFAREPRYQGSGSSKVNPSLLQNAWDALAATLEEGRLVGYSDGIDLAEAASLAARADVALVFVGLPESHESEGFDRVRLDLPTEHNALVEAVAAANPRTVVVLSNGAPVLLPWLARVNAVLETYLGGQAWGPAVVDLLLGRANPSGRLAETFPASLDDEPSRPNFPGGTLSVAYAESIYVGYRYYDSARVAVLFPFGHGLSYTTFAWSDLRVEGAPSSEQVRVGLTVRNTGDLAGAEVVQLYVQDVASTVFRPTKELKAFSKVYLQPGEEARVEWVLGPRAFAFWDTGSARWVVEGGEFRLLAAASAADVRLATQITLAGSAELSPWAQGLAQTVPEYQRPGPAVFADLNPTGPFRRLLGRDLGPRDRMPRAPHTRGSTLFDVQDRLVGRLLYLWVQRTVRTSVGPSSDPAMLSMMEAVVRDMPLRSLSLLSQGALGDEALDGLVHLLNGHWWRGLGLLLRRQNR